MADRDSDKIKTDEAPLLGNSGPLVTSLYQDFIYLSLKSAETQKTYYFATMNFLNYCHRDEVEDVRDIEPTHVREYLDHRIHVEKKEASSPTHFYAIKAMFQYLVDHEQLTVDGR